MNTVKQALASIGSLAFIGTGKNVGKTTTMNHLIETYSGGTLALTSIGRDGESEDLVTGTEKPRIYIKKGMLIATSKGSLQLSDISRNILMTTGIMTPMGEVIIVEALSDGYIDLAGPSIGKQVKELIEALKSLGADMIFVDGALDRKSMANPMITDAAILCTGAPIGADEKDVAMQTNVMLYGLGLPVSNLYSDCVLSIVGDEVMDIDLPSILHIENKDLKYIDKQTKGVYIKGVLTDSLALQFIALRKNYKSFDLVVEDGTKIFLTMKRIEQLNLSGIHLKVRHKVKCLGVSVNPKKLSGIEMNFKRIKDLIDTDLPVFNVMDVRL